VPLYDKSLGDALYAVAAYLALSLVFPHRRPLVIAALTLAWCLTVEAFQATGIPARHVDVIAVHWLIGTEFAWHDVACCVTGVAAVVAADALALGRRRAVPPRNAVSTSEAGERGPGSS
jgi:hypothetical protein